MSLEYISKTYNVPAKVGARVMYEGNGYIQNGTIVGSRNAHLLIRFDGDTKCRGCYHPTWEITYLDHAYTDEEVEASLEMLDSGGGNHDS